MMGSTRPLFGKVLQRNVKTKVYKTSVPGAPDGEYVVIQFQTKFEHKASAIETVTPSKEKDGSWLYSVQVRKKHATSSMLTPANRDPVEGADT